MGDKDPPLSRDVAREVSILDVERCRHRPRKVADSADVIRVAVTAKAPPGGLRPRFLPRWLSGSGDEKVVMVMSMKLSFSAACVAISNPTSTVSGGCVHCASLKVNHPVVPVFQNGEKWREASLGSDIADS